MSIPEPALLGTALRVLSELLLHRRHPSSADVALLKAAAPNMTDEPIDDLAAEIIHRERAKLKVAICQAPSRLAELRGDVTQARAQWLAAIAELDAMAVEVPSNIPPSDSTLRIQKAGQKRSAAYQKYKKASQLYREELRRSCADHPNDSCSEEQSDD
jgi:hypothetical protein